MQTITNTKRIERVYTNTIARVHNHTHTGGDAEEGRRTPMGQPQRTTATTTGNGERD